MPTAITLKNIPDDIYKRLKEVAGAHHRSVNMEVIACLEQMLLPSRATAQEHLAKARELRNNLKGRKFNATEIDQAIDEGRP